MNQPRFKNQLLALFVSAPPLACRSLDRADNRRRGQISVTILFFAALTVVLVSGFVFLASSFLQLSVRSLNKARAFDIAEAGVEYYRWHLAHAPQDYQDGTGQPGPYTHTYYDKGGNAIGQFVLAITPPPTGSNVVTVRSTGVTFADTSISKIIEVKLAIASFVKYAWLLNAPVYFGSTAEIFGSIQSNAGIHFDGLAHNLVSSALNTYTDPDSGLNEWAVYTTKNSADPRPPTPLPSRPDVFAAGRSLNVPAVDFTSITQNLSSIKSAAQASSTYFASSTVFGYDLALATSGIYTVYKVTALTSPPRNCTNDQNQSGWGTWSIQSENLYATGTIPQDGQIFFEDNLWVRGQINSKRLTIASGRFPDNSSTRSSITVNNALRYTNYNASDSVALIAQNNINVGLISDDNLRIDAAMIAQNGQIGRYSYSSSCGSTSSRSQLTTYGMMGTALRSAFYYSSSDGYQARTYIYDSNLLYSPPPKFPLTSNQYSVISWNEIQ